jgi:hypothetical protein
MEVHRDSRCEKVSIIGHALKWYMNSIEPGLQGNSFTLNQLRHKFIIEFKLPQSKKQALFDLLEIQ